MLSSIADRLASSVGSSRLPSAAWNQPCGSTVSVTPLVLPSAATWTVISTFCVDASAEANVNGAPSIVPSTMTELPAMSPSAVPAAASATGPTAIRSSR